MSRYPLVTIITPTFNRVNFIEQTINSVLDQDYANIEHIVLDDGSTDNTSQIVQKYKDQIIYTYHENMGEAKTVNKGFTMSHGEIVCVLNSDDTLLPRAVITAISWLEHHQDIGIVYPDWNLIDENSRIIGHNKALDYDYLYMVSHNQIMASVGSFIRADVVKKVGLLRDPSFRFVGDFDFWLKAALHCKFMRIPCTLSNYRVHSGAISVNEKGKEMAGEVMRLITTYYSFPDLPSHIKKAKREAFAWANITAAIVTYKTNKLTMLKYILKALYYYPIIVFGMIKKLRYRKVRMVEDTKQLDVCQSCGCISVVKLSTATGRGSYCLNCNDDRI